MRIFLAQLSVMLVAFFYMLFSDGSALDFIAKIVENLIEVIVFLTLMITVGWSLYILISTLFEKIFSLRLCKCKNKVERKIDQSVNYQNDETLNFCNECKDKKSFETNSYCRSIKNLYTLVKETSKDISYKSIAVTGEWGSGKSSVVMGLKELLQKHYNDYIVIYIDVWKYRETSQIISALQDEINNKIGNDAFFIQDYLYVVASWYGKENVLQKFLPAETQSQFEDRIVNKLHTKRLVIMIDEIDRVVDKSELMEILKLIKVHSGIKKTTVITAISQKHFLQTMGEVDPKYLQKYFYHTFPVPVFSQQDFLGHNHKIFKHWESSGNHLEQAYRAMRDEYFEKESWKFLSNHREAKQLFSLLERTLVQTLNSHIIVQQEEIVKKYSILFFYLTLLHTANLGLYLQIDSIDEENDNEIIKLILEHVSINDLQQLYKEFKQRKISYGSHPWFLICHYIDNNQYDQFFNELHAASHHNHDREHYKLLLDNISFEQLIKLKASFPYFLNVSKWVYQMIERLDKHQEFKIFIVESFKEYQGTERLKKLVRFIADIENKELVKWSDINWNDFEECIVDDVQKNEFNQLTLDVSNISQIKKNELKELLRPLFERNAEKWQKIEEMTEITYIAGVN